MLANQSGKELEKELAVHQMIEPWIEKIKQAVVQLDLSPMNQKHYSDRVDYYSAVTSAQSQRSAAVLTVPSESALASCP